MLPTAQAANGPKHITAYAVNNANYTGGIEGGEGQQEPQTSIVLWSARFALLYATTPHPTPTHLNSALPEGRKFLSKLLHDCEPFKGTRRFPNDT